MRKTKYGTPSPCLGSPCHASRWLALPCLSFASINSMMVSFAARPRRGHASATVLGRFHPAGIMWPCFTLDGLPQELQALAILGQPGLDNGARWARTGYCCFIQASWLFESVSNSGRPPGRHRTNMLPGRIFRIGLSLPGILHRRASIVPRGSRNSWETPRGRPRKADPAQNRCSRSAGPQDRAAADEEEGEGQDG